MGGRTEVIPRSLVSGWSNVSWRRTRAHPVAFEPPGSVAGDMKTQGSVPRPGVFELILHLLGTDTLAAHIARRISRADPERLAGDLGQSPAMKLGSRTKSQLRLRHGLPRSTSPPDPSPFPSSGFRCEISASYPRVSKSPWGASDRNPLVPHGSNTAVAPPQTPPIFRGQQCAALMLDFSKKMAPPIVPLSGEITQSPRRKQSSLPSHRFAWSYRRVGSYMLRSTSDLPASAPPPATA